MVKCSVPCLFFVILGFSFPAWANDTSDCQQFTDLERTIRACGSIIATGRPGSAVLNAYLNRAYAYGQKQDYDNEIADEAKAIELNPRAENAYANRGYAYEQKRDYTHEIADETKAIELNPKEVMAYVNRGYAYGQLGDRDHEIADETKAIALDPKMTMAYIDRSDAYLDKQDYDTAVAEASKAISLHPANDAAAMAYANRGQARAKKGDSEGALADLNRSIELKPDLGYPYYARADLSAARGDTAKALADFRIAADLLPTGEKEHGQAVARIAELEKPATPTPQAAPALGNRVALVIGNSDYAAVGKLANPQHDAEAIAAALKDDGFEVTAADNVNRAELLAAINRFSDTAGQADLAVIYFAGHGLQLDGVNYLVPVDARLAADRDVADEAIALDRLISAVRGVRKLGLVVVDACRNNPFLANMHVTDATREARTRGLARVTAHGTTLVEFSAQEGEEALDGGPTGNSPFAAALAKRLATPGLELNKVLRQVREDVLAATNDRQEPMFSGSLPAEDVFFRLQ